MKGGKSLLSPRVFMACSGKALSTFLWAISSLTVNNFLLRRVSLRKDNVVTLQLSDILGSVVGEDIDGILV
jgi:hypothetical protein